MERYLEMIGRVLEQARLRMYEPRKEILEVLPKGFKLWHCRKEPGWKPREIVDLVEYLYEHTKLVERRISGSAIWKMENGTGEYSLKVLLQYAYILNVSSLPLEQIEKMDDDNEDK